MFTERDLLADYLPTPEEIAEGCRQIQASWSEDERDSRLRGRILSLTADEKAAAGDAYRVAMDALTRKTKAMVAARAREVYDQEAKARQGSRTDLKPNLSESLHEGPKGRASDQVGKTFG